MYLLADKSSFNYSDCTDGDVRLVGGVHNFQGTVQICLDSVWCLVAQNGWDDNDAKVVCKQLKGYNPSGRLILLKILNDHLLSYH